MRQVALFVALATLILPAGALAATRPQPARPPVQALGALQQLPGAQGCLVARSAARSSGCTRVRALSGPAAFVGSRALAISGDGRHVYAASSRSDAIAIFRRDARTGALTQAPGAAGCVAARGAGGCARARALDGPNSLAISADGRSVYATSLLTSSVAVFRRDARTGALAQLPGAAGCLAGSPLPGCATARALDGPDVVVASPDGRSVYIGSFRGSAVASFARDAATGALTQLDGAAGCLAAATDGCAPALALLNPEGLAVSPDGASVYVAAPGADALLTLARDASSGALSQATDGSGCIVSSPLAGCTTGTQLGGADAVVVSPDGDDVYVTAALSDSLTSFTRAATGQLTQQSGTSACAIYLLAVGCSLGRAMETPEGLAVSPDGASVYVVALRSGALDVFDRDGDGALMQKPRRPGCVVVRPTPDCLRGRALRGASAVAVSPDGRNVYAAAFSSDAVTVFKRTTRTRSR